MKKYSPENQRMLAKCAVACARRVLPLFENARPADDRPRRAIQVCRKWIRTGIFSMTEIREASLGAHDAARDVPDDEPAARFAARAAGQAVATAHVTQHAFGAAYYALKAIQAADRRDPAVRVRRERIWQSRRLPPMLRREFLKRVVIRTIGARTVIGINKGAGY